MVVRLRFVGRVAVAILLLPAAAGGEESPEEAEEPPLTVAPTAAGGIGHTSSRAADWGFEEHRFAALWSGITIYPAPANVAGFVSIGAQVHLWEPTPRNLSAAFIPTFRGGVAGLIEPDHYMGRVVPVAKAYGLVGYRIPREDERGAFQVGLGISAPPMLLATAAFAERKVFVPTALEATLDVNLAAEAERFQIRYGVEF